MEALLHKDDVPKQSVLENSKSILPLFLKGALEIVFSLYVVALTCSMAGMEILSWTTALLFILYAIADRGKHIEFHRIGIEIPLFCLLIIAILGLRLNAPDGDFVYAIGRFRNFALLFFFTYCFQVISDIKRLILIILSCATIIAVYGIWQHFSGIDLWRHNHRALVLLPWTDKKLYSTVGFFNHHLTYAHSFGMLICIPWAILLLKNKMTWVMRSIVGISFLLIATSIIFTYGRGIWITLFIVLPALCLFINRKVFIMALVSLITVSFVIFKTDKVIRDRADSVVAENYRSNEERIKLWEANFEMFREHPWIGVGFKQNEGQTMSYYKKLGIVDGMDGHAHNNYIEFLATTGATGLLCYLIIIGMFMVMSVKLFYAIPPSENWTRVFVLAAIGAQMTFHIGGLTQCNFADSKVQHQLIFWLALISYFNHIYRQPAQVKAMKSTSV